MRKPTVEELLDKLSEMPADLREREISLLEINECSQEELWEGPEFTAENDGRVSIVWGS